MRILKILLVILLVLAAGYGGYYYMTKKATKDKEAAVKQTKDELQKEIDDLKKQLEEQKQTEETQTAVDEYAGWKTYTNKTIGYSLKYPSDWTAKEVETYSETIDKNVKYITITTPNGKYFLYFGLKKPTNDFEISDRTGIGAGDMKQKTEWTIKILNVSVTPEVLVLQNKVKEIFYNQPSGTTPTCNCQFTATFSYTEKADYNTYDMASLTDERSKVEKILKSVKWL